MASTYNLGDLFDLVADAVPDRIAVICDNDRLTYRELKERSDRLAAALARHGVKRGQSVGLYMYNGFAYLEALLATFKLGAISFNINYRYEAEELYYILNDAKAVALVHGQEFEPVVAQVLDRLPGLKLRVVVAEPGAPVPGGVGVVPYSLALAEAVGDTDIHSGRSAEDRLLLYTGGTTGAPKGVEWSHLAKFFGALGGGGMFHPDGPITSPEQIAERASLAPPILLFCLPPLMHGAAMWSSLITLLNGMTLVMTQSRHFNAELIWDLISREQVNSLSFTGDAMAVPLVDAWDAHPGRWDASMLMALSWGGAPLSKHMQGVLKQRFPNARQMSGMGSSEGGLLGNSSPDGGGEGSMRLAPRADLAVIVDGLRFADVGEMGILSRSGYLPNGYWGDPKKTAETFITLDGKRWVLTGDQVRLEADGSMVLFGRGSSSINSGAEKIFPEEVEAAIRSHPAVLDTIVVGVPDQRWGETVAAVVALREGTSLTLEELQNHCEGKLARYKFPRKLSVQQEIKRSPAGKANLRWAKAILADA